MFYFMSSIGSPQICKGKRWVVLFDSLNPNTINSYTSLENKTVGNKTTALSINKMLPLDPARLSGIPEGSDDGALRCQSLQDFLTPSCHILLQLDSRNVAH